MDRRAGLKADGIELTGNVVQVYSRAVSPASACSQCGVHSRHVHSHYWRRLADPPVHGREVWIHLRSRRFRCCVALCRARIFAERFSPALTQPHARRTGRLQDLVWHLVLALGVRPAQALAGRLLLPVSKDIILRSLRREIEPTACPPRVIGLDDWVWRRGQRYGTLIYDLERRRVIDLLPDRAGESNLELTRRPHALLCCSDPTSHA